MSKLKKGLDGRARDKDGEIRHKRSDTLVKTIRDEYGPSAVPGVRADATLGTAKQKLA